MTVFFSQLINGLSLGSIYALIALGYSMVYGIILLLNFAHGDIIMIGGYVSFCAMFYLGLPNIVAVLLAVIVCTVLGVVIERLAYKPLRSIGYRLTNSSRKMSTTSAAMALLTTISPTTALPSMSR